MRIQLSEHFNYRKLLRFTFPSIVMMIFTSIYGVIDGLFVSNFVGKTQFAAVNIIIPFLMILGSLGFMVGTGGSAIVSMTLGERKPEKAKEYFSMLIYITITAGILLSIIGLIFIRPITVLMGAQGEMIEYCVTYGRILIVVITAFLLQNVFQSFLVTAEKPHLGLAITAAAGLTNIILDFLFIAVFKWGVIGAAAATAASQIIGGILPLIYFAFPNESSLRLVKAGINARVLLKACSNGASELMTNISMSVVSILYNIQLMRILGENGVATYGVIMYVTFIFLAIFMGYSIGSAPIIGYHYGAGNKTELRSLFKKSLIIIGIFCVILTLIAEILSYPLSKVFVGYDLELLEMTVHAFTLYSTFFLFTGFNIWGSAFFTALNNGVISATISFLRTFVLQIAAIFILPIFIGSDGIWLAVTVAEILSLIVTTIFFITARKKYEYL